MPFGKTSHADTKSTLIRMLARFIESADKPDQIDRVWKGVAGFIVRSFRRSIAPKRENVSDGSFGVTTKDHLNLFFIVANAGQMRNGIEFCGVLNSLDQIVR